VIHHEDALLPGPGDCCRVAALFPPTEIANLRGRQRANRRPRALRFVAILLETILSGNSYRFQAAEAARAGAITLRKRNFRRFPVDNC
jgi:hypothetical protein